jgi:hypothetical protein
MRKWRTYVSTDGTRLYHYRGDKLYRFNHSASRTRHARRFQRTSIQVPTLPVDTIDTIPASLLLSPMTALLRPTPYPMSLADPNVVPLATSPTDFFALILGLPYWQSSLLEHLEQVQPATHLKDLLESDDTLQLYLVSDGGAKGDLKSFG